MNDNAFKLTKTTPSEYFEWCKNNHKAAYKTSSKREFFTRIQDGRLVRDLSTNKLVRKNKRK